MDNEITTNTSGPPLLTEAEAWRLRALAAEARVKEPEAALAAKENA